MTFLFCPFWAEIDAPVPVSFSHKRDRVQVDRSYRRGNNEGDPNCACHHCPLPYVAGALLILDF
jgi:hypothetical protein